MSGLTPLGIVHTVFSLIAIAAGIACLWQHKEVGTRNAAGAAYVAFTVLTALTALGILQHGGFGPPHAVAILTLLAIGVGLLAERGKTLGVWSRSTRIVAYSSTLLFHMIPGFTESLTRLPLGAPLVTSAEDPIFKLIYPALFVIFLVGVAAQLRYLRKLERVSLAS
jgi:uncharacterized membrane protein